MRRPCCLVTVLCNITSAYEFLQDEEAAREQKQQLHAALWNQGSAHFQAKNYGPAQELFRAALHFAADGTLRAKAARTLAICALALKDHARHEAVPSRAQSIYFGDTRLCYMRIRRLLLLERIGPFPLG